MFQKSHSQTSVAPGSICVFIFIFNKRKSCTHEKKFYIHSWLMWIVVLENINFVIKFAFRISLVFGSCKYFYNQIKTILLHKYTVNKYTIHIHCISGSHPDQLHLILLVSGALIFNSIVLFSCSTSPWLCECPRFLLTILHWPGQIRRVCLIIWLTNSFPFRYEKLLVSQIY